MAGRPSAQHGCLATRSNRCEVARLQAGRSMSDAIDAAMLADQCTSSEALLDLLGSDPGTEELPARHHSMRRACHPRELTLNRCPGFYPHQGGKSAHRRN